MVDLHHHLLPGLDDGATDLETSLEMARMAAKDGITHIVATPHANNRYQFDRDRNEEMLAALRETLAREGIQITLGSGCDFHLSYDNIQDARQHPHKYSINGQQYLLIELPDHAIPPQIDDSFYDLRLAGITLILTHPERNPTLQKQPERLKTWVQQGMLLQVTTSSVIGHMGPVAEKMARKLLSDRWVQFLATDAHNLTRRPPKMRAAYDAVSSKYGAAYAQAICVDNPLAVFEGRELPPQEEPRHLFETEARPSFLKRLFGATSH
jgi:protein-tyrosine phosphatase